MEKIITTIQVSGDRVGECVGRIPRSPCLQVTELTESSITILLQTL